MSSTKGAKHKREFRFNYEPYEWSLPLSVSIGLNFVTFRILCLDFQWYWVDEVELKPVEALTAEEVEELRKTSTRAALHRMVDQGLFDDRSRSIRV